VTLSDLSLLAAAAMGSFGSGHCVAMCGGFGAGAGVLLPPSWAPGLGIAISIAFVIALGLYLGDWWRGLTVFERLGAKFWRHLEPLGRRFLPVTRRRSALAIGLLWGWLPCGLVYAALALALVSGGAWQGASTLLAFGLGTLPALIALGFAGRWLAALRHAKARRAAGASLCVLGVVALLGGYFGQLH